MIRVYLDSSDYSVMADPRQLWAQDVLSFLQKNIDSGVLEVRFSYLHPLEGAHTNTEAKFMAIRRAQIMAQLSGRKCLEWWHSLVRLEAARLALGKPLRPADYAYRNDGRWFPQMRGLADDLARIFTEGLQTAVLNSGLPAGICQQVMSKLLKNGRLTQLAVEMMRPSRRELMDELRKKYPWPQRFFDEDLFFRYAAGEIPAQVIVDALEEGFGDLPLFVGWAYDSHDPDRQLTRWLRAGNWTTAILKLRDEIAQLVDLAREVGKDEKHVNTILRKAKSRLLGVRARILRSVFADVEPMIHGQSVSTAWKAQVLESELGTVPALDSALEASIEYFIQNVMAGAQQRRLLVSDFGDIMHMGYLPYVDVFRCDAYAAGLARKAADRYGTEIVHNLRALPAAVTRLAAIRTSKPLRHP